MKMKDVWRKPLTYGVYSKAVVNGNTMHHGYGMLFYNEEPAKAVVFAVNNHDKLVEHLENMAGIWKCVCESNGWDENHLIKAEDAIKFIAQLKGNE